MAQHLTLRARRLPGTAVLFCALAAGPVAAADAALAPMADPTRPPESAESAAPAQRSNGDAGPRVQSILVSNRRREAIVDGQVVKVGDRIGESRVVAIRNTEVVLADASGARKSLRVFADLGKNAVHTGDPAAPHSARGLR